MLLLLLLLNAARRLKRADDDNCSIGGAFTTRTERVGMIADLLLFPTAERIVAAPQRGRTPINKYIYIYT
jgi:hypothetical protein